MLLIYLINCGLFKDGFVSKCQIKLRLMNNKLEDILKGSVEEYFKGTIPAHVWRNWVKSRKNISTADLCVNTWTQDPPNTKKEYQPLISDVRETKSRG